MSQPVVSPAIGDVLAAARTRAGLSLEDVAAATRIRRTIVAAVEADDFRLCGGDFYARAHLRSIARVVGTDPTPLLAQFDASHRTTADVPLDLSTGRTTTYARKGPNWSAAMIAVLLLVVGVGLYRVVSVGAAGQVDEAIPRVAAPSAAPRAGAAKVVRPVPRPRPAKPPAAAPVRKPGVEVRLAATSAASWVKVTGGGGRQLFMGNLQRGSARVFDDPQRIRLVVGNAGAVSLMVNGKRLASPGPAGSVARMDFPASGPITG